MPQEPIAQEGLLQNNTLQGHREILLETTRESLAVDDRGRLVGRVTIDDIIDVIQEEATEDIYEMAAIISDDLEVRSVMAIIKRRLPWLLVYLVGTLFSGG